MNRSINVLVIEDDFRVAEINRQLVEKVAGFQVIGVAKSAAEALSFLKEAKELPDLLILDVYIPDSDGLSLFWTLRTQYSHIDVIMLTAAKEAATIEEALRGGIFDYIVKPVDFTRFEQTLERYREQRALLSSKTELVQEEIDRLTGLQSRTPARRSADELPKGIDRLTLQKIQEFLDVSPTNGVNAAETGEAVGVSRSTARRYLEYLVSIQAAKAELNYGDVGRPERKYIPWTK